MTLDPTTFSPFTIRPVRASAFAIAAVTSLLITGCGTGGDDAATTTTTTEAETTTTDDATTTTEGGDETTTTEGGGGGGGGEVSAEDLESVMPDVSDIGPDYVSNSDVEEGQDEPSESDDELAEACPEAARFMDETGEDDRVARLFEADDNREIEVKLDPTPNANFDEDTIDTVIDAVNACDVIELEDDGITMEMTLSAERDDSYGDRGVVMQMTALMDHAEFPSPITLEFSSRAFVVGSVSVSLNATDGATGATPAEVTVVPGDHDLLEQLAERLEADVAALQD